MLECRQNGKLISCVQEDSPHLHFDLVCFSHLRWNFVYQRPQHLLSRCAQQRRVFFIEEPVFDDGPSLDIREEQPSVWVVVPHLPAQMVSMHEEADILQQQLINELFATSLIDTYVLWYYNPLAISFTEHLKPLATIYDCMDELSGFKGASPRLKQCEERLFVRADLVFTGGYSLYQAKCQQHSQVYAFPSSVDTAHFSQARVIQDDPSDQASIPHLRLGFYGVIDERFDVDLLRAVADAQPDWHFILIGPIVKISPDILPQGHNIHYLGEKHYNELPSYLAGWDVALILFAHNEATRFISPTKTLEYLAGGKPIVSTSIRDVVLMYGEHGVVHVADSSTDFIAAIKRALDEDKAANLDKIDTLLAQTSWDATWNQMQQLIEQAASSQQVTISSPSAIY